MRRPFPSYLDIEQMFRGYNRPLALSPDLDRIICGHGSSVIERYPPARPELAAR